MNPTAPAAAAVVMRCAAAKDVMRKLEVHCLLVRCMNPLRGRVEPSKSHK